MTVTDYVEVRLIWIEASCACGACLWWFMYVWRYTT